MYKELTAAPHDDALSGIQFDMSHATDCCSTQPPTCMLWKQEPSLTSRKTHSPPPAPRPVLTQPPTLRVCPTCNQQSQAMKSVANLMHADNKVKRFFKMIEIFAIERRQGYLVNLYDVSLQRQAIPRSARHRLPQGWCLSESFQKTLNMAPP